MARYIDAEKLCKALRDMAFYQNPYKQSTILGVVESIENFPTADVAPRAEVAREIFEEIDTMIFGTIIPDDCAIISIAKLAELKKKYTATVAEPPKGD